MADTRPAHAATVLTCVVPDEPPEYTVVATGRNGAGRVWMREDSIGRCGPAWWHPAGRYFDERDNESVAPLTWAHLVARYRHLKVLRWGEGGADA